MNEILNKYNNNKYFAFDFAINGQKLFVKTDIANQFNCFRANTGDTFSQKNHSIKTKNVDTYMTEK